MWGWLLLALLPVLLLILLVLVLLPPVDVWVTARLDEEGARTRTTLGWLGLRRELRPSQAEPREDARPRARRDGLAMLRAMLRTEGATDALRRLARRGWRGVRVRMLDLRLRLGLGDPAETGMAMGALAPLVVLMRLPRAVHVDVEPDFERERIDLAAHAHVRLWPIVLVAAAVAFLCTPAVWRAMRAGRARRRRA